jgi:hypothetical protein
MMDLVVAGECGRKQWLALWSGWRICTSVYPHAEHLAVPVEHGVEVGGGQPVVLQLRMDDDLGIHLSSPRDDSCEWTLSGCPDHEYGRKRAPSIRSKNLNELYWISEEW